MKNVILVESTLVNDDGIVWRHIIKEIILSVVPILIFSLKLLNKYFTTTVFCCHNWKTCWGGCDVWLTRKTPECTMIFSSWIRVSGWLTCKPWNCVTRITCWAHIRTIQRMLCASWKLATKTKFHWASCLLISWNQESFIYVAEDEITNALFSNKFKMTVIPFFEIKSSILFLVLIDS